jgi:hypothetical protein
MVRTPLEDLGVSMGLAAMARADLSAVSFELRLGLGRAQQTSAHFSSTTWDDSAAAAVLRMHDSGPLLRTSNLTSNLTWGFGGEAGVSYMAQTLDDGDRRSSWNPFLGPVALVELTIGRRFFVRADVGLPVYALRVQTAEGATETSWRLALSTALGAGMSF